MSRPTVLGVGNVQYWTIALYDSSGALVDADSTPTVAIRKNGASTSDVVTVTKRTATTGLYDCSYNPGSENQNDTFQVEETATISATAYFNSWQFSIVGKTPLGFDSVSVDTNTGVVGADLLSIINEAIPFDINNPDYIANRFGEFFDANSSSSRRVNNILYTGSTIANVTTVGSVTNPVSANVLSVATDAIDAAAIKADAVAEIQTGLATATELATVPKIGTQYTHTAQSGDTIQVTIS